MVSKSLPRVEILTASLMGEVQVNQPEEPPELPAISGAPGSLVAPALLPVTTPAAPVRVWPAAKLSLAGCASAGPVQTIVAAMGRRHKLARRRADRIIGNLLITHQTFRLFNRPGPTPACGCKAAQRATLSQIPRRNGKRKPRHPSRLRGELATSSTGSRP